MCLHPQIIKNPSYDRSSYVSEFGACIDIPRHLRPTDKYIEVPCGKCADCRSSYYNSLLQRALVESLTSYMYFVTLTYDNDHLPCITLPSGDTIYYSDYKDIQNMFKRFRDSGVLDRDFRYLSVTEFGDSTARPHAHLLIFVSKLDSDTPNTPKNIERILFDNLQRYYAYNIGTRKNPVYEKLFSYALKYTVSGPRSNYFVKYVEPNVDNSHILTDTPLSDTYVKTIRYLIGYVNKGSAFDSTVERLLDNLTDLTLVKKLRNLLRSTVRFSKGFGCGFVDGRKHYLPRISVKASSSTLLYSDIATNMPSSLEEFRLSYPDYYKDLHRYILTDKYSHYTSLDDCIRHMSSYEYLLHCLYLFYYPKEFNRIYTLYYRDKPLSTPSISYFFNKCKPVYHKCKILTTSVNDSYTYRYLRSGVEEAISAGVPFIAFKTSALGTYTALCRYYKERVSTIADFQAILDRNNLKTYQEWKELFNYQLDLRKAQKVGANAHLFANTDKIIWKSQKTYLNLPRRLEELDIYRALLTD